MPEQPSSITYSKNKIIAKNTLLLYVRMFVTIIIGLYTSRVILSNLGVSDYGIYNLVGGIVSMLAFLNVGMSGSTQRFITYELGKGTGESLRNVFSNAIITHFAIAGFIAIIMETAGVWLVNHKLVIPPDRLFAANCVFQCSIITFFLSVISVPYNACVIAHEKMGQFAYISILDTVNKLLIAIVIGKSPVDKLILYSVLILCSQLLVFIIYIVYCRRNFEECAFKFTFDKNLFKKMFSFAAWGCVGNMGFTLKDQLSNIILNLFFGTTINAARGIATQVNGIVSGFAGNFTVALNPQITKEYASGNVERSHDLAMAGSKYAFYLLSFVTIPFILNIDYLLHLWLGSVPQYADLFVSIILFASCVYSMSHTMSTAILATGHVKWFQSLLALTLLLEAPLTYIVLYSGGSVFLAVLPCVFTNMLSLFLRIYILHYYNPVYGIRYFCVNIFLKNILMFALAFAPAFFVGMKIESDLVRLIITTILSLAIFCLLIYTAGLDETERNFVNRKVKNILGS